MQMFVLLVIEVKIKKKMVWTSCLFENVFAHKLLRH